MNNIYSELFTQSAFVEQLTDWHWVTHMHMWVGVWGKFYTDIWLRKGLTTKM